jgi:hypothetical protein
LIDFPLFSISPVHYYTDNPQLLFSVQFCSSTGKKNQHFYAREAQEDELLAGLILQL